MGTRRLQVPRPARRAACRALILSDGDYRRLTLPMVSNLSTGTPGYPSSVTKKGPSASLTVGTQFVTVNQLFTIPFGRAKFCKRLALQTSTGFQALVAVPVGVGRARKFPFPRWERSPKKSGGPNGRFGNLETAPGVPDLMLQNVLFRF